MLRFVPSLLDRLIDVAPGITTEPLRPAMSIGQLKDTIARDVESLLNSRCGTAESALAPHVNASGSVLAFGLQDFASRSMSSNTDRDFVCRSIERAITNHEPRLRNVTVTLERREVDARKLRFSIQALLIAHPLQEPVNYDAVLQTTTQSYAVQTTHREA